MIIDPKKSKLVIEISKGATAKARDITPEPEGMLTSSPYKRRTFRRRKRPGALLQFYDLGRILSNGVYVDNIITILGEFEDNSTSVRVLSDAEIAQINAFYLATPVEELTSKHQKVAQNMGNRYNLAIGNGESFVTTLEDDNPNWTPSGLNIPENILNLEDIYLYTLDTSGILSENLFIRGSFIFNDKVTSTPSYEDTEVTFVFRGNEIFFLMPMYMGVVSVTSYGFSSSEELAFLNMFYQNATREHFYNVEHPYFNESFYGFNFWQDGAPLDWYSSTYERIQKLKTLPEARAFRFTIEGLENIPVSNFPNPTLFPAPPSLPASPGETFPSINSNYVEMSNRQKLLTAIVKQGDNYYYFWRRVLEE